MNDLDALLDFSLSVDDWMVLIKRFIEIIDDFFTKIGINLFQDATVTDEADTTAAV